MLRDFQWVVCAVAVSLLVGCQKTGLDGLVPVSGTVTFQGKPIEGAEIAFGPDFDGRSASGRSDAEGKFQLTTLELNDGAQPGDYKVAISKRRVINPMTAEEAEAWFSKHDGPPPTPAVTNDLPAKYSNANTSGLTAKVVESGENQFKFELD